jgi:hypothetical protein
MDKIHEQIQTSSIALVLSHTTRCTSRNTISNVVLSSRGSTEVLRHRQRTEMSSKKSLGTRSLSFSCLPPPLPPLLFSTHLLSACSTAMDERKLSKKEKKALAFRANKGKNKALDAQPGVPEEEDLDAAEASGVPIDDGEGEGAGGAKKDKGKKEKVKVVVGEEAVEGEEVVEGEGEKKKKRQRGKKKSEQRAAATGKVGADGKSRLILFVGTFDLLLSLLPTGYHTAAY